jgi:outer membrane protein OmpA-like peptidoglycan-associated protein
MIRKFMVAAAAALMLMGCTTTDQITGERTSNRTANGALIGAGLGAALGTLAGGNDGRNAAIGAVVGGLAGAGVGHYMDSQYQNLRQRLAGTGVGVTRISESEILLNFPSDLTFDFNRDSVKGEFVPTLSNVAQVLAQYPETNVNVIGHTDSVGSDVYNQGLSERRARSVATVLAQSGVAGSRLTTSGMGERSPIADNTTDSGRARNRRVEVRISAFPARR